MSNKDRYTKTKRIELRLLETVEPRDFFQDTDALLVWIYQQEKPTSVVRPAIVQVLSEIADGSWRPITRAVELAKDARLQKCAYTEAQAWVWATLQWWTLVIDHKDKLTFERSIGGFRGARRGHVKIVVSKQLWTLLFAYGDTQDDQGTQEKKPRRRRFSRRKHSRGVLRFQVQSAF